MHIPFIEPGLPVSSHNHDIVVGARRHLLDLLSHHDIHNFDIVSWGQFVAEVDVMDEQGLQNINPGQMARVYSSNSVPYVLCSEQSGSGEVLRHIVICSVRQGTSTGQKVFTRLVSSPVDIFVMASEVQILSLINKLNHLYSGGEAPSTC